MEGDDTEVDFGASACNLLKIETLPLEAKEVQKATLSDNTLSKVRRYRQEGWPDTVAAELKPYASKKGELSIDRGCVFCGARVVIPAKCQARVLKELHIGHQGIVKMKGLARSHAWWPGIDRQIEELVRGCDACQENRNLPPVMPLHPWPWTETPWERIHIDFAGPFMGSMFLVLVDSHSKWLEVDIMASTTTEKTIEALRAHFARFGQLVSDNGPQFTSKEFVDFLAANGIQHARSAPYHPATNGAAERFVQTFKQALRAGKGDEGTIQQKLSRFLIAYRNTPHSTTGVSPAELLLKGRPRTRLDLMRPSVRDKVVDQQQRQKKYHDKKCQQREFTIGQSVWVHNVREGPKWLPGTISDKTGPVSYEVTVNGQVWRRHAEQLLKRTGSQPPMDTDTAEGEESGGLGELPEDTTSELEDVPDLEEGTVPAEPNTGTATSAPATGAATAGSAPATGGSGVEVTTATPTSATEVPGREVSTHPVRGPTGTPKSYPRRERHMTDRYEPVW